MRLRGAEKPVRVRDAESFDSRLGHADAQRLRGHLDAPATASSEQLFDVAQRMDGRRSRRSGRRVSVTTSPRPPAAASSA